MRETNIDWIFQGPVCAVLIINLIFLCRIMWVRVKWNSVLFYPYTYLITLLRIWPLTANLFHFFSLLVSITKFICIVSSLHLTSLPIYIYIYREQHIPPGYKTICFSFLFYPFSLSFYRYLLQNYVRQTQWKLVSIEKRPKPFSYSFHYWVLLIWWLWLGQTRVWAATFSQ